jgi:hypothetical protein
MAINGVPTFNPEAELQPERIEVNVNDRADLAVAALEVIYGNNWDRDRARKDFARDFDRIEAGVDGWGIETYPHLPIARTSDGSDITAESAFAASDAAVKRPDGTPYPATWPFQEREGNFSRRLWTPGDEGYDVTDINRMSMPGEPEDPRAMTIHARAALLDGPESDEPLLQLLDMPFDRESPDYEDGGPTQVEELARLGAEFEAEHPDLNHRAVILGGFLGLVVQRRLEREGGKEEVKSPLAWDFARIPYLGRKTVGGVSIVGYVGSDGGQFWLGRSRGSAFPDGGLVFSVGLNETVEPQAS